MNKSLTDAELLAQIEATNPSENVKELLRRYNQQALANTALEADVAWWRQHSALWALEYAEVRQKFEANYTKFKEWVAGVQGYARVAFILDVILVFIGFLIMMGAVPPIFPNLPWWWK